MGFDRGECGLFPSASLRRNIKLVEHAPVLVVVSVRGDGDGPAGYMEHCHRIASLHGILAPDSPPGVKRLTMVLVNPVNMGLLH